MKINDGVATLKLHMTSDYSKEFAKLFAPTDVTFHTQITVMDDFLFSLQGDSKDSSVLEVKFPKDMLAPSNSPWYCQFLKP